MQGADKGFANRLDGHDLRVGIVQARFNDELTGRLAAVCIDELVALGVPHKHIHHVTVPGALEVHERVRVGDDGQAAQRRSGHARRLFKHDLDAASRTVDER